MLIRVVPLCLATLLAGWAQAQPQDTRLIGQGQRLWQQRCTECHTLDVDDTGPHHRGVFGRRAGSVKGYDYSRALRKANLVWDETSLDRWLTDPEKFLPGQNMDYRVRSKAERAALIAYLKSLSPAPASDPQTAPPAPHTPGGSTPAPRPAAAPPRG
ncbi:cytochrome c [Duganella sp. 1224]|uniref:c-type cytochrome n=1 Tax=Duganella sp. 1224 TaxID=2587052 RepID=UPI0015C7D6C3|nr:c-type cytochrome [Duganella sp. 1224]NYE61124.1 cytochrome c [Duganella sp. 1224]